MLRIVKDKTEGYLVYIVFGGISLLSLGYIIMVGWRYIKGKAAARKEKKDIWQH